MNHLITHIAAGAKLDVATVDAFLEFLYTDRIRQVPAASKPLLALAKQYGLPRLASVCRNEPEPSTLASDLWGATLHASAHTHTHTQTLKLMLTTPSLALTHSLNSHHTTLSVLISLSRSGASLRHY